MKKYVTLLGLFIAILFIATTTKALTLSCSNTLRYGSTGDSVKRLQTLLNQTEGCGLAVDGIYGEKTTACVRKFQTAHHIAIDGIAGPVTCTELNGTINTPRVSTNRIYVAGSFVNIREYPTVNSKWLGSVSRGKTAISYGESNGFYKIKYNGKYAWISKEYTTKNIILLDLSDQTLYYYKSGNLILRSRVVTGNKGNHDTPKGYYTLTPGQKSLNQTLRGRNDNGTYYARNVTYWIPFIPERGIGFHDASWREDANFNVKTYNGNGSLGCVNMPTSSARILYEQLNEKTLVIVRD